MGNLRRDYQVAGSQFPEDTTQLAFLPGNRSGNGFFLFPSLRSWLAHRTFNRRTRQHSLDPVLPGAQHNLAPLPGS